MARAAVLGRKRTRLRAPGPGLALGDLLGIGDRSARAIAGGERLLVAEADARDVPGARGPHCLILETEALMRRIWHYPADWDRLEGARLIALFEAPLAGGVADRVSRARQPEASRDEHRHAAVQR